MSGRASYTRSDWITSSAYRIVNFGLDISIQGKYRWNTGWFDFAWCGSSSYPSYWISLYLTVVKQKESGAVSAANSFLINCSAGILLSFTVPLERAMNSGPFFSLMTGINVVAIILALIPVIRNINRVTRAIKQENGSKGSLMSPIWKLFKGKTQGEYQRVD